MRWILIMLFVLSACCAQAKPDVHIGFGVWVYELWQCEGGDINKIVAQAQAAHLGHVLVRVNAYGDQWAKYNPKAKVVELTKALQAKGIRVFAWGYNYPTNITGQTKFIESVLAMGFDGYVFNVETEFANCSTAADKLFSQVRQYRDGMFPDKLLGYSTFARVDRGIGARMPCDVFGKYCDVAMPQAYWRDFDWAPRTTAGQMCKAWAAMEHRWRDTGKAASIKPLVPTAHAYDGSGPTEYIKPVELANFLDAVDGYCGANVWTWQRMAPEHWKVLETGPSQYLANKPAAKTTNIAPAPRPEAVITKTPPAPISHRSWWYWTVRVAAVYVVMMIIIYLFQIGISASRNGEINDNYMAFAVFWFILVAIGVSKTVRSARKKKDTG